MNPLAAEIIPWRLFQAALHSMLMAIAEGINALLFREPFRERVSTENTLASEKSTILDDTRPYG
jgi:hypothetical protein